MTTCWLCRSYFLPFYLLRKCKNCCLNWQLVMHLPLSASPSVQIPPHSDKTTNQASRHAHSTYSSPQISTYCAVKSLQTSACPLTAMTAQSQTEFSFFPTRGDNLCRVGRVLPCLFKLSMASSYAYFSSQTQTSSLQNYNSASALSHLPSTQPLKWLSVDPASLIIPYSFRQTNSMMITQ